MTPFLDNCTTYDDWLTDDQLQERLEAVQELVAGIEELSEVSATDTKKSVKNP